MSREIEHEDAAALSPEAWRDQMVASLRQPELDGLAYPAFPDAGLQQQFVGSDGEHALTEAWNFYEFIRRHAAGWPQGGRYLDFGCGWGRITRFFLRDFRAGDMAGVDVDPAMVAFCRGAGVPGVFRTIRPGAPLPFADNAFALVTAYSVFTHLPRPVFEASLDELFRVLAPGGRLVITVEPPRFLDFIGGIDLAQDVSEWHASLAAHAPDLPRLRGELKEGGFAYLPTGGGGAYREPDVYGEAVVSQAFLREAVRGRGRLELFFDQPEVFWQAVAVISKPRPARGLLGRRAG